MKKLLVAAVFAAGLCGVGFVLSACAGDSGKEAWLYTDLGKEEFESLRKKCYEGYKNREDIDFGGMNKEAESACEQFASIALENDNFCERFINNEPKRKINKKDYFLAGFCYYNNKTGDKADNEKQAFEYMEKACENKDFMGCREVGDFYRYASDDKTDIKESLSVWKKGLGYYDKACELGAKFACKMGLKQTLQKLKANLNETKKACEEGNVLMCEILKEL